MAISMIAAVGKNMELGRDNQLIWHFKEDMKFFKETTMGNCVIMGRKTFESLPKALPNRRNIVITTNPDYVAEGCEVVTSIEEALALCDNNAFVIGGGSIYSKMLDKADKLYLTEIDDTCDFADAFFPKFNKKLYNKKVLTSHISEGIAFCNVVYSKKQ